MGLLWNVDYPRPDYRPVNLKKKWVPVPPNTGLNVGRTTQLWAHRIKPYLHSYKIALKRTAVFVLVAIPFVRYYGQRARDIMAGHPGVLAFKKMVKEGKEGAGLVASVGAASGAAH